MKLKQVAIALLSLTFLITGCGNSKNSDNSDITINVSSDYVYYNNIDKLADVANVIIKGYILSSEVRELNYNANVVIPDDEIANPGGVPSKSENLIYTVYTIKISQAYKGNVKANDTIEIAQIGGELKNKKVTSAENIDLKISPKDEYVFFLSEFGENPTQILTPFQGCYEYKSDIKELKSVAKDNPLKLTTDELLRLQEKYK